MLGFDMLKKTLETGCRICYDNHEWAPEAFIYYCKKRKNIYNHLEEINDQLDLEDFSDEDWHEWKEPEQTIEVTKSQVRDAFELIRDDEFMAGCVSSYISKPVFREEHIQRVFESFGFVE